MFGGRYTLSEISKRPECAVSYPTLRNSPTDPDDPDRQWTAQEVEEAASRPRAAAYRRTRAVMARCSASGSTAPAITVASAHGQPCGRIADRLRYALGFIAYAGRPAVGHSDDRPKEGQ